jgi:hypothetical protein
LITAKNHRVTKRNFGEKSFFAEKYDKIRRLDRSIRWEPYWNNLCVFCVHSVYIQKKGGRGPQGAGDTNAASEIYGYNFSIFCTRNALIQRYVII